MTLTSTANGNRRDVLVRAVEACLRAAHTSGDYASLLGAGPVDLARKLAMVVTAPGRRRATDDAPALRALAWVSWLQYQFTGERSRYDQSLYWFREVLAVAPGDVPPAMRRQLTGRTWSAGGSAPGLVNGSAAVVVPDPEESAARATRLYRRYHATRDPDLLREAIREYRAALAVLPTDRPERCGIQNNLGVALVSGFETTGKVADVDEAIALIRDSLPQARDVSERRMCQSNLARALRIRFERTGDRRDVEAAVPAAREAVAGVARADLVLADRLGNLALTLLRRFQLTGDPQDVNAALATARDAVAVAPAPHPERPGALLTLSTVLRERSGETGADIEDLGEAVRAAEDALDAAGPRHPDRPRHLAGLANALRERFERSGDRTDIERAVSAATTAVDSAPFGHPERRCFRVTLASALAARFGVNDDERDQISALGLAREVLSMTPPDHTERAAALGLLGTLLIDRYRRTGRRSGLDEAVTVLRHAVDAVPPDGVHRCEALANLAAALRLRAIDGGQPADLDRAVSLAGDAVDAAIGADPRRPVLRCHLCAALFSRFEAHGDPADLAGAVREARTAVSELSTGRPERALALSALAETLLALCATAGDRDTAEEALSAARAALAVTGTAHPERGVRLVTLADAHNARYAVTGRPDDLDAAVASYREAVAVLPPDHPAREAGRYRLAVTLLTRHDRFSDRHPDRDVADALEALRTVAGTGSAGPRLRFAAASLYGTRSAAHGTWAEAHWGFDQAVHLLPEVTWHGTSPESGAGGGTRPGAPQRPDPVPEAVTAAIMAGEPARAVELAEFALSVLGAGSTDRRDDRGRLAERQPVLAAELDRTHAFLVRALPSLVADPAPLPGSGSPPVGTPHGGTLRPTTGSVSGRAAHHYRARERRGHADRWNDLVDRVRALPGFETFLAPVPFDRLRPAAAAGPVVLLNAGRIGGHALLVTPGQAGPRVVDLPDLRADEAATLAGTLRETPRWGSGPDRGFLFDVLAWLWEAAVAPVLDELGITGPPPGDRPPPRVWWCTAGPLAVLPLHAAGQHARHPGGRTRPADTVGGRVVSSSVPTLGALIRARRQLPADPRRVVAVAEFPPDASGEPVHPAVLASSSGRRDAIVALWSAGDGAAQRITDGVRARLAGGYGSLPDGAARALHGAVEEIRAREPDNPCLWAPYLHLGP